MSATTAVDVDTAALDTSAPAADPARSGRLRELFRAHAFTSWSAQKAIDLLDVTPDIVSPPLAITHGVAARAVPVVDEALTEVVR